MGIKGMSTHLKRHCYTSFSTKSLSEFKGQKIAIDINIYLYKFKKVYEENWLIEYENFIKTFKKYDITIFLVYDNKFPDEKKIRYERRKCERELVKNTISEIRNDLNYFQTENKISPLLLKITNIKNGYSKSSNNNIVDIRAIETEIHRLSKSHIYINRDELNTTKKIAQDNDITILIPQYEAETLCSELCIAGIVDSVLSNDTDVFAYQCPVTLTNLKKDYKGEYFVTMVLYDNILKDLDLTSDQFLDFCILCGSDYNLRIKNFGNERSYNLIKKYKSIENLKLNTDLPVNELNFERVREIFKTNIEPIYTVMDKL
jgi:5'-3' exonuclease